MQTAFRFAHAPERSAYPLEAPGIPSRLRRSHMSSDESLRRSSVNLDIPPFPQARIPHDPPASAIHTQTHPPAAPARSVNLPEHLQRAASPSLTSRSRIDASPPCYPHVCSCGVVRVDATCAHPPELAPSGCAGTTFNLRIRRRVPRRFGLLFIACLCVLPVPRSPGVRGPLPSHLAVRYVSNSRVFGVSLTS